MQIISRLQINFDPRICTAEKLSSLFGVQPTNSLLDDVSFDFSRWIYEVERGETDPYFDFINEFLDILEGKYFELSKLNIQRESISFWMFYEYDKQCNMEFDPARLKRLGENGISLCVSCWKRGERLYL